MKSIFSAIILLLFTIDVSAQHYNMGLCSGINISNAQVTQAHAEGKLTPGIGTLLYIPVSYNMNGPVSLEVGAGYYFLRYKTSFSVQNFTYANGHPFLKVGLAAYKNINEKLKIKLGLAAMFDFFPVQVDYVTADSVANIVSYAHSYNKNNQFISAEIGIMKLSNARHFHQLSFSVNNGFKTVEEGTSHFIGNSENKFSYAYKRHFLSLAYTYWLFKQK